MSAKQRVRLVVCVLAVAAGSGCQIARDLLPRTHTTSASPDGRYTAFVRQHLNTDPPDDHLYLSVAGRSPKRLMSLAPDADWCRTIIWTRDSRRVGFLINDQRLAIFDTGTTKLTSMLVLVEADGYPGSQEARSVAFGDDGTVSFERFDRPTMVLRTSDGRTVEAPVTLISSARPFSRPARSRGLERLQVPDLPPKAEATRNY